MSLSFGMLHRLDIGDRAGLVGRVLLDSCVERPVRLVLRLGHIEFVLRVGLHRRLYANESHQDAFSATKPTSITWYGTGGLTSVSHWTGMGDSHVSAYVRSPGIEGATPNPSTTNFAFTASVIV